MRLQGLDHAKIMKFHFLYMSKHWFSTAKTSHFSFKEILRMENNLSKESSLFQAIVQEQT